MKLKYTGPARDYSGYGEATRHDLAALTAAKVQVLAEIPTYTLEISDFGRLTQLASQLEQNRIAYNFKILHVTPNVYERYFEPNKYHIARAFWETDKVPLDFAVNLEKVDEIWTGSEFNKQAMINAGITKPIFIIPEAIDDTIDIEAIKPYLIPNNEGFKFYSIFEWTERKNPRALLEAFWLEFQNDEKVSLTIKTYIDNFTPNKKTELQSMVRMVKKRLKLDKYADVFIYDNLMDRHQIYRFHKTFDCFVSAHRGEGWGVPQMEAMLLEKPIISTACGGIHEYMTDEKDALLIPFKMIPLRGNNRNEQWYTPDQNWADIDIDALRKALRFAYENQKKMQKIGQKARQTVLQKFSLSTVGELMRERLQTIENTILYPTPFI